MERIVDRPPRLASAIILLIGALLASLVTWAAFAEVDEITRGDGRVIPASKTQIIALEPGDIRQTTILRDALENRGVFGAIFFPPATPDKRCIIRFTVNCGLSRRELDRIIEVCGEIREEVGMAEWRSTKRKFAAGAGTVQVTKQREKAAASRLGRSRVLNRWLNHRKLNSERGSDVDLGTARDRASGTLDNHPAK